MAEYSIGLDVGGTNLRGAALDRDGNILERISTSTDPEKGREHVVGDIVSVVHALREKLGGGGLVGIGLGVPGFIRLKDGVITNCTNLRCLENYSIRDDIERRLGARLILENDANAAAMGEKWRGAGRGVDDLVLLTLGTGIGGGIISEGRILHGFLGMAGEIGHTTVVPNGYPCGCGNRGCLEKHASASAIAAMARALNLGDDLDSKAIFEMAQAGNENARAIFISMGEALGIALATLVNTFNFPLYLLSGGPLPAWDYFAPAMIAECRRRSFTFRTTGTRIEKATLGGDAGLYGAAYLPWLNRAA